MNGSTWSTRREAIAVITLRKHLKRTATIASIVGTIFFSMNQLGIVLSGRATALVWLKVALTYLTPLCVSNIGILSATRRVPIVPEVKAPAKRRALAVTGIAAALLVILAVAASAASRTAGVFRFADGSQVPGAQATLATLDSGARMTLRTSELPAGHSVTVWWVVFNEPENCIDVHAGFRCGPGDLPPFGGDDSAVTSILYAAGHVVGGSGKATFSGHLSTGDTEGALFGPGLINPTTAEIHLVVRDHGPKEDPSQEIHSFGACNPTCTDIQFSPLPQ